MLLVGAQVGALVIVFFVAEVAEAGVITGAAELLVVVALALDTPHFVCLQEMNILR